MLSSIPGFNPLDASSTSPSFYSNLKLSLDFNKCYLGDTITPVPLKEICSTERNWKKPVPLKETCSTERNFSNDSLLRNCPYAVWKLSESLVPGGSEGKESACNARDLGWIPGSDRFPGEGNGCPLQYSCLESLMNRGTQWVTVHGISKSWTQLHD